MARISGRIIANRTRSSASLRLVRNACSADTADSAVIAVIADIANIGRMPSVSSDRRFPRVFGDVGIDGGVGAVGVLIRRVVF
jgi:hypothetical protein